MIWAFDSNSKRPSGGLWPSHVSTFSVSPLFSLHIFINGVARLRNIVGHLCLVFEPNQKPPDTELSNAEAFSFPVFTFIADGFLLIMKMEDRLGNARQPVCLFANLQLTNTLVRVERDYKIRQYFTPCRWIFFSSKLTCTSSIFFGTKRKYADDINLTCLDKQIPFFSELALGASTEGTDKRFEFLSIWIEFFIISFSS